MDIDSYLEAQRRRHLYRERRVLDSPQGPVITIEGRQCLNFCSNDYLGLANHPRVIAAFTAAARQYGVGSGASQLVCGHSSPHHALEEALASFLGRPRALLFSTGYMANLGVVTALAGRHDDVFEDRLNHASLIDAARLADCRLKRYPHGDVAALRRQLDVSRAATRLVVTDGVFSMDGDLAPLPGITRAAAAHEALLMVDDAHGIGVLGKTGRGVLEHLALGNEDVPLLVGTFGKAFGTFGAFVAGDAALVDFILQRARSYIYTTAPPPAVAAASLESLALIQEEGWRRDKLRDLVGYFREGAAQFGVPLGTSEFHIQPLVVGEALHALELSAALQQRGILVSAIRPPTVPEHTARLRISFSAGHETQHVDTLLAVLADCRDLWQATGVSEHAGP
jgi:8-amino-7-oxononanoate synthase